MPTYCQIIRDGEPLSLCWGAWHQLIMQDAAAMDLGLIPSDDSDATDYMMRYEAYKRTPLYTEGQQTLTKDWSFVDTADGEELELKAGDVLRIWR